MTSSKVSFTIRRPPSLSTSSSRNAPSTSSQLRTSSFVPHEIDSSDEDAAEKPTEFVTSFDEFGAQRLHAIPPTTGPLVIPPLANRDWRMVASHRRQQFIPEGAEASIGKDGSQGGLGTKDTINSGPQTAGLVRHERLASMEVRDNNFEEKVTLSTAIHEESEDERARKALLASLDRGGSGDTEMTIGSIPLEGDTFARSQMSETEAYRLDVITRPDSATLADYERVPVSQFGAALLRGMGWKEGTAASRSRDGPIEPWLPTTRPALLGIGAKERPADDTSMTVKGGQKPRRPEKRYVPVVKMEREGSMRSRSTSPSRSASASRAGSKSSSPYPSDKDRRYRPRLGDKNGDYDRGLEKSGRIGDRRHLEHDNNSRRERQRGQEDRHRGHREERDPREEYRGRKY